MPRFKIKYWFRVLVNSLKGIQEMLNVIFTSIFQLFLNLKYIASLDVEYFLVPNYLVPWYLVRTGIHSGIHTGSGTNRTQVL